MPAERGGAQLVPHSTYLPWTGKCLDVPPVQSWATEGGHYLDGQLVVKEREPAQLWPNSECTQSLALVLRGDTIRKPCGKDWTGGDCCVSTARCQSMAVQCARSIKDNIIDPAQRSKTAVDAFLSVYPDTPEDRLRPGFSSPPIEAWREYSEPINANVALVTMVNRSSQLGGIAAAVESWRSYLKRHWVARYTAVLLLRYDLHWKNDLPSYMRSARFLGDQLQAGIGFLWREVNGEYGTSGHKPFPTKWWETLRVPDTAIVFSSGHYADCFLRLVKVPDRPLAPATVCATPSAVCACRPRRRPSSSRTICMRCWTGPAGWRTCSARMAKRAI